VNEVCTDCACVYMCVCVYESLKQRTTTKRRLCSAEELALVTGHLTSRPAHIS